MSFMSTHSIDKNLFIKKISNRKIQPNHGYIAVSKVPVILIFMSANPVDNFLYKNWLGKISRFSMLLGAEQNMKLRE